MNRIKLEGYAVISKKLLLELENDFNVKTELPDGTIKYEYYGEEGLLTKPRWDSVIYQKDKILKGDIYQISCSNRHNSTYVYNRHKSLEYLIDMTDHVVVKIMMDGENYYTSDLYMVKIGECGTIKQALDIMDKDDPDRKVKISFNTSLNFLFSIIFSQEKLERSININTVRVVGNHKHMILEEDSEELDTDIYKVNMDNLNKISSTDFRPLFLETMKESVKDKDIIKELILSHLAYLVKSSTSMNVGFYLQFMMNDIDEETQLELIDDIINIIPMNRREFLFDIFSAKIRDEGPVEKFLEAIYSANTYNYSMIDYFLRHHKLVDLTKLNKKKFVKASSLKNYYFIANQAYDEKIAFMADSIISAGTAVLQERMVTLACFTNMYSEEEFKALDITPLCDAIASKLLARFHYELRQDISVILGTKINNMQYLCDKVIERMCENNANVTSRVKLIKSNANVTSKGTFQMSIFDFLNISINKSDDIKIAKAILKYDL